MSDSILITSLKELLRPLIRLCIRHAVKLSDLDRVLKALFVEEARKSLTEADHQESISKLSVMTGLQRPVVKDLLKDEQPQVSATASLYQKVIGAWQTKEEFTTKSGSPKVLATEGKQSQFASLVKSVSKDTNPYTVLFELERAGVIQRSIKGVRLLKSSLVSGRDQALGLHYLASDLDDLVSVASSNIFDDGEPQHHLTTEFDSIPAGKATEVNNLLLQEGNRVHKKIRELLASYDTDIMNLAAPVQKIKISFTSFGRVKSLAKERDE